MHDGVPAPKHEIHMDRDPNDHMAYDSDVTQHGEQFDGKRRTPAGPVPPRTGVAGDGLTRK